MKVRDLMKEEIDIDVYDDVCDALQIAFVGPAILTDEAEKDFADVLDLEVKLRNGYMFDYEATYGLVKCGTVKMAERASKFFCMLAGYCSCETYDKYVEDQNYRVCDVCGRKMSEGFLIYDTEYYCSEECLHTEYSEEEYAYIYDNDYGYWTMWE